MNSKSFYIKMLLFVCASGALNHLRAQHLPALEWYKGFGGKNPDYGNAIATDKYGQVYTTGTLFNDSVVLNINNQPVKLMPNGAEDVFITKQDVAGNYVWARTIGGNGSDFGHGITVDNDGGVYVTGYFTGTIDFNPGSGKDIYTSVPGRRNAPSADFFVCKFDSTGNFLWVRVTGSSIADLGQSIVYDSFSNAILITGGFGGAIDFGFGAAPATTLTSAGDADVFVLKMTPGGDLIWVVNLGGADAEQPGGVAVDRNGNVYTTGYYYGEGDYDPDPVAQEKLGTAGSADVFVSKLDKDGKFIWARSVGGKDSDESYAIALDSKGNVHITGVFRDTANFDPNGVHKLDASAGAGDVFILKLTTGGDFAWVKSVGSTADDIGHSIAVGASENVYITGYFQGLRADFDPGLNPEDTFYMDTYVGNTDAFILKLDSNGLFKWAMHMGPQCLGRGITTRDLNIYTTGNFYDTVDFDPESVRGRYQLISNAGWWESDVYILKLIDCEMNDPILTDPGVLCMHKEYTLTLTPVPGAGNYMWELPSGWTGSSNTNEIVTTPLKSGVIKVSVSGLCDTITREMQAEVSEIVVRIDVDGEILKSSQPFASYQWLKGDTVLNGATDRNYRVLANGSYAVIVTNEHGCVDTSGYYYVNNVGIPDRKDRDAVRIYPVPVADIIHIDSPVPVRITLSGIDGRILRDSGYPAAALNIGDLPDGIYFVTLTDAGNMSLDVRKIIKQR